MSVRQEKRIPGLRRFGLRSLMVLITTIGVLLAIFVPRIQNQTKAIAEIQSFGGSIWFKHDSPRFVEFWQNPDRSKGVPATSSRWLTALFGEDSSRTLVQADFGEISPSTIDATDSGQLVQALNKVASLETVRMKSMEIDATTFNMLSQLRNVKNLTIDQFQVADQNLKQIARMPSLETLNIANSKVTDEGVQFLKDMPQLKRLRLYSFEVTTRGLESIMTIPKLQELILYDCNMTLEEFQSVTGNRVNLVAKIYFVLRK